MKKLKISITGCLGRMGQQTIKSANINKNIKIVTLTESKKTEKKINNIFPERVKDVYKIYENKKLNRYRGAVVLIFNYP